MAKPRVGVDVDGVLYNFESAFNWLAKWKFGVEIPPWQYWNFPKDHLTNNQWQWMWGTGVKSHGLFRHGHLYPGAAEGLRELARVADIVLITHRPAVAAQDTLRWVVSHELPVTAVNVLSNGEPKWMIPADLYVDDKPENIQAVIDHGLKGILWNRPWNEARRKSHPLPWHGETWLRVYDLVKNQLTEAA